MEAAMPTILTTELVLTAIGLGNVLAGKPTLHRYQTREANQLPKLIKREILRVMATSTFEKAEKLPPFDYHHVLDLITTSGEKQAQALFAAIGDHDLAVNVGVLVTNILHWANSQLPRNPRQTMTGVRLDPPNASDLAKFRRVWAVANDPMIVLRDLSEGCLSDDMVQVMALLYPALYSVMRQAVSDGLAQMAGKITDWEPSPKKARQLKVLLQQEDGNPDLAAAVQGLYQQAKAPAPPKPRRSSSKLGLDDETPGQKAAAA